MLFLFLGMWLFVKASRQIYFVSQEARGKAKDSVQRKGKFGKSIRVQATRRLWLLKSTLGGYTSLVANISICV